MSKRSKTSTFINGDFISEDGVRGAFARRRRTRPATETDAVKPHPAGEASSPPKRGVPLRRWSVADLIADAMTPPTADSH